MAENNYVPSLTLNPTAAMAQEAPEAPTLTLGNEPEQEKAVEPEKS